MDAMTKLNTIQVDFYKIKIDQEKELFSSFSPFFFTKPTNQNTDKPRKPKKWQPHATCSILAVATGHQMPTIKVHIQQKE
jgi:hypothetical protein